LKIALLADGVFPYVLGGMQKHSFYMAKYLALEGVDVDLYFFKREEKPNPFTELEMKHITFFEIKYPKINNYYGHYLIESWKYACALYQEIKPRIGSYNIIYSQGFCAWKLLSEKSSLKNTPPIIVNIHGLEMFQMSISFYDTLIKKMLSYPALANLRKADYVVSLGGKLTKILEENTKSKILEIPIGIDEGWLTTEISNPNQIRQFLFVGRYERRKGIEELNKVLKRIDKNKKFTFHFVGPIPAEKQIKDKRVIYHGRIMDVEKLKAIYQMSDVLVCPSYKEGMPTVILEAMASGCAILATNVGAVALEVTPNENGFFILPGNIKSIQAGIEKFLDLEDEQLLQMKLNSKEKIEKTFLWKQVIKKNLRVFEQLLENTPDLKSQKN